MWKEEISLAKETAEVKVAVYHKLACKCYQDHNRIQTIDYGPIQNTDSSVIILLTFLHPFWALGSTRSCFIYFTESTVENDH